MPSKCIADRTALFTQLREYVTTRRVEGIPLLTEAEADAIFTGAEQRIERPDESFAFRFKGTLLKAIARRAWGHDCPVVAELLALVDRCGYEAAYANAEGGAFYFCAKWAKGEPSTNHVSYRAMQAEAKRMDG